MTDRRAFMQSLMRAGIALPVLRADAFRSLFRANEVAGSRAAALVASDEVYWNEIARAFDSDRTLVNLNNTEPRTLVMQGGAYGEHRFESVTIGEKTKRVDSALLAVQLDPGSGGRLTLRMQRYANPPKVLHPWHRTTIGR